MGKALSRSMAAELMLVAVDVEPLVLAPVGVEWTSLRKEAQATLRRVRASLAPDARMVVETHISVPRALQRVVDREHQDVLVIGSSRQGDEDRVRIGKRTRQLLCRFASPLAVAPRGYHEQPPSRFAARYWSFRDHRFSLQADGPRRP